MNPGKLPPGPLSDADEAKLAAQLSAFFAAERLSVSEQRIITETVPHALRVFYGLSAALNRAERLGPAFSERLALLSFKSVVILVDKIRTMDATPDTRRDNTIPDP